MLTKFFLAACLLFTNAVGAYVSVNEDAHIDLAEVYPKFQDVMSQDKVFAKSKVKAAQLSKVSSSNKNKVTKKHGLSDQAYYDALRGMEGIIAQARKHNPKVDIVITMFVNENILGKLQKGETTDSVKAHSKVAEHHGISVNHLAQELADLITAGKMNWKKFGGVHPNDYGNTMCATMIANALLKEWAGDLPADAVAKDHPAVPLLDPKSYSRGRLLPFADVNTDAHWKKDVPNWPKENKGKVRGHFIKTPMIYSSTAGAKLSIKFTGTAIGAYMLSGPDTAIIKATVDGKQSKEIETLLGLRVYLDIRVKVAPDWQRDPKQLGRLGF